jgi:hypothetical protein
MEGILLLIAVLACPLGMLAMGAIAWVSGKALGNRSNRSEKRTGRESDVAVGRTDQ